MTVDGVAYAAALLLAAIFAVAAFSKLRDREGTVESFRQLGVPNPEPAAGLLPLPELAAAFLLVLVPAVGGIVVLVLLAFFTTFLVDRLRSGVEAPCACFGASSDRPLSWLTLGRNLLLAVLAVATLFTMRPARPTLVDVAIVAVPTVIATVVLHLANRARATTSLGDR
jgi:hypothetical protein